MPTKTKVKTKKKKPQHPPKLVMNFKVWRYEKKEIKKLARAMTRGNVTALVMAGLAHVKKHKQEISKGNYRASTRK